MNYNSKDKLRKIFFIFILLSTISFASSLQNGHCATVEITDISPTSINIGEEFTVGITIDNCGIETPKDVTFELRDISEYITVKEPLLKNIGDLGYANSDRFIVYNMKVSENAPPGNYNFDYKLIYHGDYGTTLQKNGDFSVKVIGDNAELALASVKITPSLPTEGNTVEMVLRIENTGEGTAKSIKVLADHPFQGSKQSFIGSLESDEDGPAVFTFIAGEEGEYDFPVTVSYVDDYGENKVETNVRLNIIKSESHIGLISAGVIIILIFITGIFYFIKTKKSKDRIIQELLKGNEKKEKHKK